LKVTFDIDGRSVDVSGEWDRSLLDVMRDDLDVIAAKPGCEIGRCGACSVILNGTPVAACLVPLGRLDGARVRTAEGLRAPLLQALMVIMHEERMAQCGYCSNGLLATLAWIADNPISIPRDEARNWLAGHICRCTGNIALDRALDRILALSV
jgi:aerobic-type carbon monoxide dehydrogenase small subunit (CoxS/CutS family)